MTPVSKQQSSEQVARAPSAFSMHPSNLTSASLAAKEKPQSNAIQLSNLSSILNTLESAATTGRERLEDFSFLVRSGAYLVDAMAVGRRVIAEAMLILP